MLTFSSKIRHFQPKKGTFHLHTHISRFWPKMPIFDLNTQTLELFPLDDNFWPKRPDLGFFNRNRDFWPIKPIFGTLVLDTAWYTLKPKFLDFYLKWGHSLTKQRNAGIFSQNWGFLTLTPQSGKSICVPYIPNSEGSPLSGSSDQNTLF